MFIDLPSLNISRYDVIIAGSGPAGAVVAKTLAAKGKAVLVLETGAERLDPLVQDAFSVVHGQGHFSAGYWANHWIRTLGGTSAVWAGWVAPLLPRNMTGWPISRADLAPWYDVAVAELGLSPLVNTWHAPALPGFDLRPFRKSDPARYGGEAGAALWQDDRVHVLLNTTLVRVRPRADRRGIEAIMLVQEPGVATELPVTPAQRVVLAAGGMGNAQILLASEAGDGAAVGNETDQVGRYLMEHPHCYDCATLVARAGFAFPAPPDAFGDQNPALVPSDATYDALGPLDASFELSPVALSDDDAIERLVVERLGGAAEVYSLTARSEMAADPQNRVERTFGTDPAGLPRLRATCIVSSDDYRAVLAYLQTLGAGLAEANTGRLRINNEKIFFEVTGGGHTMGTTRMGRDPKSSVTDGDCRVHGYGNLFVAGSSLFPAGGYANPTLTIIALAARLGAYLAEI